MFGFFYIIKKYWNRQMFRLPSFDGFARFGTYPEHNLTDFGKRLSVHLCRAHVLRLD